MSAERPKVVPGMVLWYQPGTRRDGGISVTVTRVGRKYFYLEGRVHERRVDLESWACDDNGYFFGQCYISEQEYLDELALSVAWRNLRMRISTNFLPGPPNGVTIEKIKQIYELLGWPYETQG